MTEKNKEEQIVIQQRIDKAITEEFDKLLKENKEDKLLQLLINGKLDDLDLKDIKKILTQGV